MISEIWKDVKDYEGLYQISNLGNIRKMRFINNITNKEKQFNIKPQINNSGYYRVMLFKNGNYKNKLLHRIVAETFINNPDKKNQVNHKDGNKLNNCVQNLEWCSQSENMKHAYKNKLAKSYATGKFGANSLKAKKVNMLDKKTKQTIKTFGSLIDAAKYIGVNKSCHIVSCCKGRLKTAYGYKWEYSRN